MNFKLGNSRIEAFSDGVIAIIITIMVLELHVPVSGEYIGDREAWEALLILLPKLFSYLLSFIVVIILWLSHHTLFDQIQQSDSRLIWLNVFLLFSMSLIPLPTAFIAEHPFLIQASVLYGVVMFMNAGAFLLLRRYVEAEAKWIPVNIRLRKSNLVSSSLYLLSVPAAFVSVYLSWMIFIGIHLWFFFPDKFHKSKNK